MARTRQTARALGNRPIKTRNSNKSLPEFQNFTFAPNIIRNNRPNFPMSTNLGTGFIFIEQNNDLSIYSLLKECISNIPKDFKLVTLSNKEYLVNKIIILHTSNLIKKMIEEDPSISSYKIQLNDCDSFISKFSSILNGNSEKITKEDVKIARKISKELGIDGFPLWMKPKKQSSTIFNYQNQFNRKPPKFSVLSISSGSFLSFLKYQKHNYEFKIQTKNNIYKVPLFGALCSSLISNQLNKSIFEKINNPIINSDNNNDNDDNTDNNDNNNTNINNNDDEDVNNNDGSNDNEDKDDNNKGIDFGCFFYDFSDENKEFKALANYMSGDRYNLTDENMELSLKFAKDLGITKLYNKIQEIANEYNKRNELIQENLYIMDDVKFLRSQILQFQDPKSRDPNSGIVDRVFHSLLESIWCSDKERVKEMTIIILRISTENSKMFDQISKLFVLFNQAKNENESLSVLCPFLMRKLFSNLESINNPMNPNYINPLFYVNYKAQLILYLKKNKFLSAKDIVYMIGAVGIPNTIENTKHFCNERGAAAERIQQNSGYYNYPTDINLKPIHYFFSPEIEEVFPKCLPETCIVPDKQRYVEGEEGSLMNAIYNDDVERFKEIESSTPDFELNQTIYFPMNFDFTEMSIIEYAAKVDSPNVFQYIFSKFSKLNIENDSNLKSEFLRNINWKVLIYSIGKSRSIIHCLLPYIDDIFKDKEARNQDMNLITSKYIPTSPFFNDSQNSENQDLIVNCLEYMQASIINHDNEMLELLSKKCSQYVLSHSLGFTIESQNIDAFVFLNKKIPFIHSGDKLVYAGYVTAESNFVDFFIFLTKIFGIDKIDGSVYDFQFPNHFGPRVLTPLEAISFSSSIRLLKYIFENFQKARTISLGRVLSDAAKYDNIEIVEFCLKDLNKKILPREITDIMTYLYLYKKPEIGKIIFESCPIPDEQIIYFIEVAAAANDLEFVTFLVNKQLQIKPNSTFTDAFNSAAKYGCLEICQYISSIKSEIRNNNNNNIENNENDNYGDLNENNNDNNNNADNENAKNENNNDDDNSDDDDSSNNENGNENENRVHVYSPVENLGYLDFKSTITLLIRNTFCYIDNSNSILMKFFTPTERTIEILRIYFSFLSGDDLNEAVIRTLRESVSLKNNEIASFALSYNIKDKSSFVIASRNGMFDIVQKLVQLDSSPSFINHIHGIYGSALNAAIEVGQVEIVDYLLSLPDIDVNTRDSYQMSPLVSSAFNRHYEIFTKIIKTGKFLTKDINKALLYYSHNTKIIQPFISSTAPTYFSLMISPNATKDDIQKKQIQTGISLLDCQVSDDDLRNVFPNLVYERQRGGLTYIVNPLSQCAMKDRKEDPRFINFFFGSKEKVDFDPLVDSSVIEKCRKSVDFTFYYAKETFLIAACKFGRIELVKLLLDRPETNVNAYDNNGNTPLIHAVARGHFGIVRLLCEQKKHVVDINQNNFFRRTAFSFAADINRIDIIKYIAKQPSFDPSKSQACTAVAASIISDHKSITRLLLEGETSTKNQSTNSNNDNNNDNDNNNNNNDNNIDGSDKNLFIDFDVNKEILFNHLFGISDPSVRQSVLQMPVFNNLRKTVPVQRNRAIENSSWSLLRVAVQREDVESLHMISNHPRFNIDESNADRALFYATKSNNLSVFKAMLKISHRDVNFNYKGKESRSLLCTAIMNKSSKIIKYIIDHPDFDPEKSHSNLAFFTALLSQPFDIIEICSKMKGIDFNGLCPKIPQELMVASYGQLYSKNVEGMTPLYIAATISPDVLSFLLKMPNVKIDVNCRNTDGSTPLFGAIQMPLSLDILLRQKGIDVNAQDNNGRTVLMLMVLQRALQYAPMILAREDVDLSIVDKEGKNALMYANPDIDADPKTISWKDASELFVQSAYSQPDLY